MASATTPTLAATNKYQAGDMMTPVAAIMLVAIIGVSPPKSTNAQVEGDRIARDLPPARSLTVM
jgi:hypothetical protein